MENKFEEDLCGIKGWLILIAIGVVISPIRLAFAVVPIFWPLLRDGTWRVLVTKGSEAYNPLWIPILSLEITYNIAMFAALILLNVLFFSKHCWFPRLYITIIVVTLVFLPLDAWLVSLVLEDTAVSDPETSGEIIRTFVTGMIWIPYMLKSQRVKATFTRGKTVEPTPVHEMLNNDPEL